MPKQNSVSLKEARRLLNSIEDHYNDIAYLHRLIELAESLEKAEDIKLVLHAYLPHGRSRLDDIGQMLKFLQKAINPK